MPKRVVLFVSCVVSSLLLAAPVCLAAGGRGRLPQLPDAASDVGKDVVDQIAAGTIPPVPSVVGLQALDLGGGQMPTLPDPASDVAKDVLDQIADGNLPPVPSVVGGHEPDPGGGQMPTLPDAASDVAEDVLAQIAAGTIPPVPSVVGGHDLGAGGGLDALDYVLISDLYADSGNAGGAVAVPEPATLSLLGLGACLSLLRRRR